MVCFRLTTFQGLYYPGFDRPYFSTWVPLKVTSSRPQHSRVDTRPLVILNIRLISLEMESSREVRVPLTHSVVQGAGEVPPALR